MDPPEVGTPNGGESAVALVAVTLLRGGGGIAVTGPVGEIAEARPVLEWENGADPAKKYDVWILPGEGDHLEVPMLFVAKGVRSPLAFSDLKPGPAAPSPEADALEDGDYRLLVCHADMGRMSGTPVEFSVRKGK